MPQPASRYPAGSAASPAEGWSVERLTRPSRLYGANGLRTKDGRVYVAQVGGSQVSAIDVDTGDIEVISPMGGAIVGPDDLVFDDEGNLYCTEITENKVKVLRPNGTSDVIADLRVANPITFHQGRLIAGELLYGGRIVELDRSGGIKKVILDNVPMPNAFEVGPDGKLYFPAQAANEIWRVDLETGEHEVVARDLGVPDSVKFHPDGHIVSTQVVSGQVLKIDPRTGAKEVLADIGPGLDNVAFVNGRTFISHITGSIHEIVAPGQAKPLIDKGLQWPLGLAVGEDGEIFIADGGFTYTLREGGEPQLAGMLFSEGFPGWVRDVAAARGPGEWLVTTANGTVARWRPAEQAFEELASGFDRLMGIARVPNKAVVFAEYGTGRVLSQGGGTNELVTGLDRPMGVAVDGNESVYVAESGAGRVVKLSGGKADTVIDGLGQPEGIAIAGSKLYIVDTGTKEVVTCDLVTGAREVIGSRLPVGAPAGVIPKALESVGDMCGPMYTMAGIAVAGDGAVYVAAAAEGSVLAIRPA